MVRTLASLLVFVLAGTPAASMACEAWCDSPAGAEHSMAGCHETAAAATDTRQFETIAGCVDTAATVYLSETRTSEHAPLGFAVLRPATSGDLNGRQALALRPLLRVHTTPLYLQQLSLLI